MALRLRHGRRALWLGDRRLNKPRTFARYGSLPRPNGTTQSIARVLADAKARGEAVTVDQLARTFAIAPARVERHLRILGR